MSRLRILAAVSAAAMLLTSCQVSRAEETVKDLPGITLKTAEADIFSASESPFVPDSTLPAETLPEPVSEPVTEADLPETEPAQTEPPEEFSLPEEFYSGMAEIVEKYRLNPGCDNSDECVCEPEKEELDADGNVVTPRNRVMSVYYRDILSGFEYELNPGAHYPVASAVKIPFCTLIYRRMSEGELDPEMILTYEERHYFHGSGVIAQGNFGDEYTLQHVLTLAITRSDNTALEMLKDLVSWDDFSALLEEYGCTHPEDTRRSKEKLCCESAGAYGRILADFLTSDSEYVSVFKEDLANTRIKMLVSDWPIYRKYGWAGYSFHDIAYVDAPRPYILAVLTNLEGEDSEDYSLFKDISRLVEKCSGNAVE